MQVIAIFKSFKKRRRMRRKGEVKYEENKATFEGWEWLGKFAGI